MRQGRKEREQVAHFAASRGYTLQAEPEPRLLELLEEAAPDVTWFLRAVMRVERGIPESHFFLYTTRTKARSSSTSRGAAFLAEHQGPPIDSTVEIFSRTPGVEALVEKKVEVGSREFRRHYTVTGSDPRTASEVVGPEVEAVLLEHAQNPGWYLTVTLSAGVVMVSSFWAQSEEDWDYLIGLGARLGAAIQ
jgi:hypothetical protein